jgi:Fic-DOC domain mobile mystery protein B
MTTTIALEYPSGATPLDPDELAGLIPKYITTRGELNLLEQNNIIDARNWALKRIYPAMLSDGFIRTLHKKMLKNVWTWAGSYRQTDKSIGVPPPDVAVGVRKLCDDTRYWIDNRTFAWDELGARFHHRLVWLHPFPNGNGRHARLMTDVLLTAYGEQPFSWGQGASLDSIGGARTEYIAALKEADQRRVERLIKFVRS